MHEASSGDTVPGIPDPLVIGRRPMVRPALTGLPDVVARRPDSELDGANLPGLVVRAASLRGELHQHLGKTRQDAMGFWQLEDGRLLACVADGLGSKPLSHIGAAEACVCARDNVEEMLDTDMLDQRAEVYFKHIANGLMRRAVSESQASARAVTRADLSTTLVLALIDLEQHKATLMRVGDSEAFCLRKGTWEACFPQKQEESVSSSKTHALPMDAGRVESQVLEFHEGDMLLLCSDGLARPMASEEVQARLADWWGQAAVPSLPTFFWQMSFRAKSHDDDRTAICVWRV